MNLWVFAVQVFHLLFIFEHFHNKILGGISADQKEGSEEGKKIKDQGKEGGKQMLNRELKLKI